MQNHKKDLIVFLGTGFGIGNIPFAQGTLGASVGVFLAYLTREYPWYIHLLFALCCVIIAIFICDHTELLLKSKDDRRIIADEYFTFPICMIGLNSVWKTPWLLVVCFISSRAFDIIKPPPARMLQKLDGGIGVVADDIISNLYSLLFNHIVVFILTH